MRIVHRDNDKLVLHHNWIVFYAIFTFVMVCGISQLILIIDTQHRLTCERNQDAQIHCRLSHSFLGSFLGETSIEGLEGARLKVNPTSKSMKYQVLIIVNGKERFFGEASNAYYEERQRAVDDINTFVRSSSQSHLDVTVGGWDVLMGIPLYFGVVAVILLVIWQDAFASWTFNREQGTITHRRLTPLGMRKKEYALHDVAGVQISKKGTPGKTIESVELVMNGGKILSVDMSKIGVTSKEDIATTIREFLRLQ